MPDTLANKVGFGTGFGLVTVNSGIRPADLLRHESSCGRLVPTWENLGIISASDMVLILHP